MTYLSQFGLVFSTLLSLALCSSVTAQEGVDPDNAAQQAKVKKQHKEGEGDRKRKRGNEDEKFARMKRRIEDLRQDGRQQEAERLERDLSAAWEQREQEKHAQSSPAQDGKERIRHIQEAIRHLHAADLHEPAQHLEQVEKQIRQELERHERRVDPHAVPSELGDAVGDMRRQVQELRTQMQKLMQQMQELQARIRTQHDGDPKKGF